MIYKLIPVAGQQCFTWLFNINPNRPQLYCMCSLIKLWCIDILLWELSIMEKNCFYDSLFLVIYWHWKCDIHYAGNDARMLGLHLILLLIMINYGKSKSSFKGATTCKTYLFIYRLCYHTLILSTQKCMKDTLHCTSKSSRELLIHKQRCKIVWLVNI